MVADYLKEVEKLNEENRLEEINFDKAAELNISDR